MSHIAIWKYYDESMRYYFNENVGSTLLPTYVDRIKLDGVPELPIMNKKVENVNGLLQYSSGSFRVRISLTQTETSVTLNNTIRDFLFPETKPCKFLCQVYFSDTCHWAGFFTTVDLTQALTYSQGDLYIDVQVRGCLSEFADSYSQANQGTRVYGGTSFMALETYLYYHFDTHYFWSFEHPTTTYRNRVGSSTIGFSARLQSEVSATANFNNISRWETFKQLSLSLGFNYKLEFQSPSQFTTERPDFKLKIFWLQDLTSETALELDYETHDVSYSLESKEWIFIPSRYASVVAGPFGTLQHYQGIMFNATQSFSISVHEIDLSGNYTWGDTQNQPCFIYTDNSNIYDVKDSLVYRDPTSYYPYEAPKVVLQSTVNSVVQEMYSHDRLVQLFSNGYAFNAGAMTYGHFICDTQYSHKPAQDYLVNTYARYVLGLKEIKDLTVTFDGTEGIDLFKRIVCDSKDFYISEINDINLKTRTAQIKAVEL